MFVRSTRLDVVISAVFVIAMGACGNSTGCCASQPLPGGKLPADQTVEGGAQVRVTQQGFQKLTQLLPAVISEQFAGGFCINKTTILASDVCYTNVGQCAPGCKVNVNLTQVQTTVTDNDTLNVKITANADTAVRIDPPLFSACTMNITADNLSADLDIGFGIDPTTGELTINLQQINDYDLSGVNYSGCSVISFLADLVTSLLDSFLGEFIIDLLTPTINNLIQGFLPDPLGIEGMLDVGNMLSGVSPGTEGYMEARVVPGGYVALQGGGMSLGMITGINADEDPSTRTTDLDSEPARCVPPILAPNFGAPPASLPITSRSTFALLPASEFAGAPDPSADLAMGISETTLDLAGHHMVTSGAMCLGVGTNLVAQLNVGTIGILVPSMAELGSEDGKDPLLLVTRPQSALDFTVGDNTDASPALTISFNHMEVDVYAFLYERYVRAFTMDLTMNVGINLTFEQPAGMPAVIKPMLTGLTSSEVLVQVHNAEFLRETPQDLEQVLPTVFDLLTSQLGTLPDIAVPSFAGFSLDNLSIQHVTTTQDDFLAIYASLGASQMMREAAETQPLMAAAVESFDASIPARQPPSTATPKLVKVATPLAEAIRSTLRNKTSAYPAITFDAPTHDALGRELEWSWNFDGGLFHPYRAGGPAMVVSDRAFVWQGKYSIGLKSRVKGDYRTTSDVTSFPVIIDSVVPRAHTETATWNEDDELAVKLWDVVSHEDLQYAFATPGTDVAAVTWHQGGLATISRSTATELAGGGELALFVKDEAGNVAEVEVIAFHGAPGEAGCNCDASGGPGAGSLVLFVLVGGLLVSRRRSPLLAWIGRTLRQRGVATVGLWLGASIVASLQPACSCSKASETICEVDNDCDDYCPPGQEGLCLDNQCSCELTAGRTGPYSDVAVAADGTVWVSAYSQTFGDLVVAHVTDAGRIPDEAWEWVDGVPDEEPSVDTSSIRGGITGFGPDVGMYTSIAVAADGTPMVSYFDRDTASLMFAAKVGDVWQKHAVEVGGGIEGQGTRTGMYTSLTLRTDNGRPGIAYLAHVADGAGARAEVRFVAAQAAVPTSATDWQQWVVDSAPMPDMAEMDIYPLPGGLGLFIDSARLPTQAPVVVYYDRANGELKLAKLDPASGEFDAPVVLDGSTGDAGWSPSVAVDAAGVVRVAYVSATKDDFKYITDAQGAASEIIDDGYRVVGQSPDGLPKPEFHFVGDDAALVMPNGGGEPMVAYQDATTQELLLAQRKTDGTWSHVSVAGHTDPWPGAYGFFAASTIHGTEIVMSTWVIDQPLDQNWVEIFKRATILE
ncbi:MAG: hypothetical protein H0T79_02955 [Deltaproteobacteria bacterium]|nr:hypothetical protein [Deltaproteobacteria bacterium]